MHKRALKSECHVELLDLVATILQAAIMAVSDLCRAFGTELLPLLDAGGASQPQRSLLSQLLQKAGSNDKRFVIEEVTRALQTMADCIDARQLLDRLLPYAAHKNPKVTSTINPISVSTLSNCCKHCSEEYLDKATSLGQDFTMSG